MTRPISYLSLQKAELDHYVIALRGADPGYTNAGMRKQIVNLLQFLPAVRCTCRTGSLVTNLLIFYLLIDS